MPEFWNPDTPQLITLNERLFSDGTFDGSLPADLILPSREQPALFMATAMLIYGDSFNAFNTRRSLTGENRDGYMQDAFDAWKFREVVVARLLGSLAVEKNMPCADNVQKIENKFLQGNPFQARPEFKRKFGILPAKATLTEPNADLYKLRAEVVSTARGVLSEQLAILKAGTEVETLMSIRNWASSIYLFLNENNHLFPGQKYKDFVNQLNRITEEALNLEQDFRANPNLNDIFKLYNNTKMLLEKLKYYIETLVHNSPELDTINQQLKESLRLLAEIKAARFMGHVITAGDENTGIISAKILPFNMGELDKTPAQEPAQKSPEDLIAKAKLREVTEEARLRKAEEARRRKAEEAEEAEKARRTNQEENELKKQKIQELQTKYGLSISGSQMRKTGLLQLSVSLRDKIETNSSPNNKNSPRNYIVYVKIIHCLATICKVNNHNHEVIKANLQTMIEEFEAFWKEYRQCEPNNGGVLTTEEIDLLKIQEKIIWIRNYWHDIGIVLEQSDGYEIDPDTIDSIGIIFGDHKQSLAPQPDGAADQISITDQTEEDAAGQDYADTKPTFTDLLTISSELDWEVFPKDTITKERLKEIAEEYARTANDTREIQPIRIDNIVALSKKYGGKLYHSKENKNRPLGDLYFILVFESDGKTFAIAENPFDGNATYIFCDKLLPIGKRETILDMLGFQRTQLRPLEGCEFVIHVDKEDQLTKIKDAVHKLDKEAMLDS